MTPADAVMAEQLLVEMTGGVGSTEEIASNENAAVNQANELLSLVAVLDDDAAVAFATIFRQKQMFRAQLG